MRKTPDEKIPVPNTKGGNEPAIDRNYPYASVSYTTRVRGRSVRSGRAPHRQPLLVVATLPPGDDGPEHSANTRARRQARLIATLKTV